MSGDLYIFSDPHLGVNRRQHTTVGSRELLKNNIRDHVLEALSHAGADDTVVCAGDFFDTYSNKEADIIVGQELMEGVTYCLAGNHDTSNDANKRGSLEVLSKTGKILAMPVGSAGFIKKQARIGTLNANLYFLPHHSAHEHFERGLQKAYDDVLECRRDTRTDSTGRNLLFLHCNFDQPPERITDTALNLTKEDAEVLLEVFHSVFIGHEHTPASYFDGRLHIVGSVFPTSFGDISDKRMLMLEDDCGLLRVHSRPLWDKESGHKLVPAHTLLDGTANISQFAQFIDIVGTITSEESVELGAAIRRLWETMPGLVAVRNNAEYETLPTAEHDLSATVAIETFGMRTAVDKALVDTNLSTIWDEVLKYWEDKHDLVS